ncbi:MAG: hypothetical protein D6731_11850 [Planctomycetota bacterium]|nr:MAG: hypothetical protein D6731_11850 [Planctomycetota bacterium]
MILRGRTAWLPAVALLAGVPFAAARPGGVALAQEATPAADRLVLAPLPFRLRGVDDPLPERLRGSALRRFDAAGFSERLLQALVASGRFRIVDREHLDAVRRELQLGPGGFVDAERARRAGKLSGADYLLTGEVSGFDVQVQWRAVPYSKDKAQRILTVRLAADLRLIDARSGELLAAERAEASRREVKMFPNRFEAVRPPDPLLQAVQRDLVGDLLRRVVERLYPILVVEQRGSEVLLGRGRRDGLSEGQVLVVYPPPAGDANRSPPPLGRLRVRALEDRSARAEVLEGGPFPPGALCRAPRPGRPAQEEAPRVRPRGW